MHIAVTVAHKIIFDTCMGMGWVGGFSSAYALLKTALILVIDPVDHQVGEGDSHHILWLVSA